MLRRAFLPQWMEPMARKVYGNDKLDVLTALVSNLSR